MYNPQTGATDRRLTITRLTSFIQFLSGMILHKLCPMLIVVEVRRPSLIID